MRLHIKHLKHEIDYFIIQPPTRIEYSINTLPLNKVIQLSIHNCCFFWVSLTILLVNVPYRVFCFMGEVDVWNEPFTLINVCYEF